MRAEKTPWFRDGKLHFALGIENTFVPQERLGERAIDEYELTGHYENWHPDLGLVAEAGAELLRYGIPWHRIAPAPGVWEWGWLDGAMERLAELGIRPIVDLLHYGTPLWLDREFDHPDYPQHVAEYAARVAERYAAHVTDYTPVNEPMIHALFSGEYAYWPPYLSGTTGLVRMVERLARGFVLTQAAVRDVLGDRAVFVHVDAGFRYVGDVDAEEHREHARRLHAQTHLVEDLVTGRVDGGHDLVTFLTANGMSDDDLVWFAERPSPPDVMGVNYYPRHSTEVFEAGVHHGGGFADPRPTRDDGVAGLEEVLRRAAERYRVPVMLTETCVTGTVEERLEWLDASVAAVHRMRADGLDIVGYTWWPVFDMYEWTYRHSTSPREAHRLSMGLWELVERDGHLERVPTPLVPWFRDHATHRPVPDPENEEQ